MAAAKPEPKRSAQDAYGGDPLNPNDVMLERIADAIDSGKKDDMVSRWAAAFEEACDDPAGQPKRVMLAKIADAITTGKKSDEVKAWASGEGEAVPRSVYSLSHLGG